jgi:hypothetical protein
MRVPSNRPGSDGSGWVHSVEPERRNGHATANGYAPVAALSGPVTRHTTRDSSGMAVAVHGRRDLADGTKRMWWEGPDGTRGLGGMSPVELPLFGTERLAGLPDGTGVILCEGEKAAQALIDLGIDAVGTVTGAKSIPSDSVLASLVQFQVTTWADNDDDGRSHMDRIDQRLLALGGKAWRLHWAEAPEGGDAADFVASRTADEAIAGVVALHQAAAEVVAEPAPASQTVEETAARADEPWDDPTPLGRVDAPPAFPSSPSRRGCATTWRRWRLRPRPPSTCRACWCSRRSRPPARA